MAAPAKPALDFERLVGGRWSAIAGAVILVVGIALGFKWAYDNGYLRVAPGWRCAGGVLLGLCLIVTGEFLRKRINAWAAFGAYAAGLGTVYTSVYVAYRLFSLLSPTLAFGLLAATAALGVAVAWRSRLAAVGVVSLLAGYIVPLLFADVDGHPLVLPAYLLTLLAVGLILAGWLGGMFALLRTVVWFGSVLLGSVWALRQNASYAPWAVAYAAVTWCAFQGELFWSAKRRGLMTTPPPVPGGAALHAVGWFRWRPLTSSFSTTAWAVGLSCILLSTWGLSNWLSPAAVMVATACLGLVLAGNLASLRDPPETDAERLGAGYLIQAMGLLLVTVALALSGSVQVVSWLILGLGAAGASLWMRSRAFSVYALITLCIAAGRLVVWDSWQPALHASPVEVFDLRLTLWTLLMALGGSAFVGLCAVMRAYERRAQPPSWFWTSVANAACASGLLLVAGGLVYSSIASTTLDIIAAAACVALAGASLILRAPGVRITGVVLLSLTTLVALTQHLLSQWFSRSAAASNMGLVFAPSTMAILACAAGWFATAAFASRVPWRPLTTVASLAGMLSLFASLAHPNADGLTLCLAYLALVVAAATLDAVLPRWRWDIHTMVGLIVTLVAWACAFSPASWSDYAGAPVTHPGLWTGLAWAAITIAAGRWLTRAGQPDRSTSGAVIRPLSVVLALVMLFACTSLETARGASKLASDPAVRGAALSIWWGLFAFGLILAGFWKRVKPARNIGLGLLAVGALKAVILDLASVPAIWRVASFIGLGLLMIAVTILYQRFAGSLDKQPPASNTTPPPG